MPRTQLQVVLRYLNQNCHRVTGERLFQITSEKKLGTQRFDFFFKSPLSEKLIKVPVAFPESKIIDLFKSAILHPTIDPQISEEGANVLDEILKSSKAEFARTVAAIIQRSRFK